MTSTVTKRPASNVPPEVIEDFAMTVSRLFGSPPMSARIMALLALSSHSPLTVADLREQLSASAGSVSEMTRDLLTSGAIEKVKVPGDPRRARFQTKDDPWGASNQHLLSLVTQMRELAERSLNSVEGPGGVATEYLLEMADYYAFLESELPSLFRRYERQRRRRAKRVAS
jgi:predicted transcriptional regulator